MGKINIGRLIEKTRPMLDASRAEALKKSSEEERRRIAEAQKKEYDKPLPDFPQIIARETRVRLLTYVAKVFNDACRVVLERELLEERRNAYRYDLWLDDENIKSMQDFSKFFEDRPVQEFSVAIRVAELKSYGSSRVDQTSVLYVRHAGDYNDQKLLFLVRHAGVHKRVCYRLQNNLLTNLPILEPILGKEFEARFWLEPFDELKKSGYNAEPGEQKVVHLEIF